MKITTLDENYNKTSKWKKSHSIKNNYENMLISFGLEKKIMTVSREQVKKNKTSKSCIDHIF